MSRTLTLAQLDSMQSCAPRRWRRRDKLFYGWMVAYIAASIGCGINVHGTMTLLLTPLGLLMCELESSANPFASSVALVLCPAWLAFLGFTAVVFVLGQPIHFYFGKRRDAVDAHMKRLAALRAGGCVARQGTHAVQRQAMRSQ